jgi:NAD(P)-dependent dehydrogenase (short-subunit alcohol dehydrogenase family)
MAAFSGTPALSAYVASKWALEGFTESLAIELKPFNIDVVLVEPGAYKTRIFFENAARAARFDDQSSPYYPYNQHLKQLVNKHMAANKRDPEEVARVLQDLVESRRTSFRNIISLQSRLRMVLVKCLPFRLYAWLVSTILMKKAGQP